MHSHTQTGSQLSVILGKSDAPETYQTKSVHWWILNERGEELNKGMGVKLINKWAHIYL